MHVIVALVSSLGSTQVPSFLHVRPEQIDLAKQK